MCNCTVQSYYPCLSNTTVCCMITSYIHDEVFGCRTTTSYACDRTYCKTGSEITCEQGGDYRGDCDEVDRTDINNCYCEIESDDINGDIDLQIKGKEPTTLYILLPVVIIFILLLICILKKRRELHKTKSRSIENPIAYIL